MNVVSAVEVAPEFSEKLSPVSLTEGERLALQCTVSAKPEPNVEWYFNGQVSDLFHRA